MKKIKSLSIGIPAHNEEANIKNLLTSLLQQEERGFVIKEILVCSDGSTDATIAVLKKMLDKRIKIIDGHQKRGKAYRLNQIFKRFTGDILFIMDADIIISDNSLFAKIMNGTDFQRIGILSVKATALQGKTLFEKIIATSTQRTNDIIKNWNSGQNYLAFKGCFLGFSKRFAKSITLPDGLINDDAYLYFYSKKKGYASDYLDIVQIAYKVPATFSDHLNQSSRHHYSQTELSKYFKKDLIQGYRIPVSLLFTNVIKFFIKQPIFMVGYLFITFFVKVKRQTISANSWEIAQSTKQL